VRCEEDHWQAKIITDTCRLDYDKKEDAIKDCSLCFEKYLLPAKFYPDFPYAAKLEKINREEVIAELSGYNFSCWCSTKQPCHADVYLQILNGEK
jgi:hypothetical protein